MTDKLPQTTKPELLIQKIFPFIINEENILLVIIFAMMVFMPIQISKTIQKQGLLLFLFGTLLYFASWSVLIYYPHS